MRATLTFFRPGIGHDVARKGHIVENRAVSARAHSYLIKTSVRDPRAKRFEFTAQKTMYGGKNIAVGDEIFVFDSENGGGSGLVARGVVTAMRAVPLKRGLARQTPRVSIEVRRTKLASRRLGRDELKPHRDWNDAKPQTELNFKFYRQATDKIGGISDAAAKFLARFF